VRFLTNITGHSPVRIAADPNALGITVDASEVQTATTVCVTLLKVRPGLGCHLMVPPSVMEMFDDIALDDIQSDVVVISDIGEGFNFAAMNRAFWMLRQGADLIALQKNLFWFDTDSVKLDCGAFILGLEAAANKTATVTGKPSQVFFETELAELHCKKTRR